MPAVNGRKPSRCYVVADNRQEQESDVRFKTFSEQLEYANAHKHPCIACDTQDNEWPERRGLCLDCFCAVLTNLPQRPDRMEIFRVMPRREIVTIAMYYHRLEREIHRQQEREGRLIVKTPRISGKKEVEKILEKYRSEQ